MSSSPLLYPPSSSPSSTMWEHGVFLCFRGADTREGFTGHLFQALVGAGIDTFMDDRLPKGSDISELLDRIEKSRISVVIFSENFASSRWCLDELVKIIECKERMGQEVLPIFYKVHRSQLRDLSKGGKTAKHLASHAKKYGDNSEKIENWRLAKYFADLKGWHFTQGVESKLVSEIVEVVRSILDSKTVVTPPDHVSLKVDDPAGTPGAARDVPKHGKLDTAATIVFKVALIGIPLAVLVYILVQCIMPIFGMMMFRDVAQEMSLISDEMRETGRRNRPASNPLFHYFFAQAPSDIQPDEHTLYLLSH